MKINWPLRKYLGELAVTVGAILGWALLTGGLAAVLPTHAKALWLASAGMLLLSLCGWKFLWTIVTTGLYTLTRNSNA